MIKYMLDTNICIYIIKKKPQHVIDRFMQHQVSQIGISSITLSELEYGAMKSAKPEQNKIALAQFVAPIEISNYDDNAAQHYGNIRAHLERHGTPIGSLDMLIAAHVLSMDSVLITNNETEFQRVPELKIDNWVNYREGQY
jgi:tRNA(fMet)-specific endonuclease VapC